MFRCRRRCRNGSGTTDEDDNNDLRVRSEEAKGVARTRRLLLSHSHRSRQQPRFSLSLSSSPKRTGLILSAGTVVDVIVVLVVAIRRRRIAYRGFVWEGSPPAVTGNVGLVFDPVVAKADRCGCGDRTGNHPRTRQDRPQQDPDDRCHRHLLRHTDGQSKRR